MDYAEIVATILRLHRNDLNNNPTVRKFFALMGEGKATYADALKYAGISGADLAAVIAGRLPAEYLTGVPPDGIEAILRPVLTDECSTVLNNAARVQQGINSAAGLGLKPVTVGVDTDRITGLIEHFKTSGFGEEAANLISNLSQSAVDTTAERNAEFQDSSGLVVTVSRYYDDVGLDHGKTRCEWCLERCGENVPYKEAYDRGMFQRHPGCGCTIEYHTEKGTQRQADWRHNAWSEVR